jgi:hypothetical protein
MFEEYQLKGVRGVDYTNQLHVPYQKTPVNPQARHSPFYKPDALRATRPTFIIL